MVGQVYTTECVWNSCLISWSLNLWQNNIFLVMLAKLIYLLIALKCGLFLLQAFLLNCILFSKEYKYKYISYFTCIHGIGRLRFTKFQTYFSMGHFLGILTSLQDHQWPLSFQSYDLHYIMDSSSNSLEYWQYFVD